MIRQAFLFVGVSGLGWLLDTAVFLALSAFAGWGAMEANLLSATCAVLFVFFSSSRSIFRRNDGPVAQKVLVLVAFNAMVIVAASFVLAALVGVIDRGAAALGITLPLLAVRFAAKVIVTPVTLALNFVVVRFLVERFTGMRPLQVPVRSDVGQG